MKPGDTVRVRPGNRPHAGETGTLAYVSPGTYGCTVAFDGVFGQTCTYAVKELEPTTDTSLRNGCLAYIAHSAAT